ncbi:hypothetical protein V1512DRAFT_141432 [Lipomyces arxii]|uniref:uncharacterized protein n=1 Tax=Lipomyces arxii TaxID=56418 RepID=UPI0034CEC7D7
MISLPISVPSSPVIESPEFSPLSAPSSPMLAVFQSAQWRSNSAWKNSLLKMPEWVVVPAWKKVSLSKAHSKIRIFFEIVLVLYILTLIAKLHHYGSLSKDQLFSFKMPYGASTAETVESNPIDAIIKGESEYNLDVFLVNTPNYHYEVFLPVVETFKRIDNINTTIISTAAGMDKWGIRNAVEYARGDLNLVDAKTTSLDNLGVVPDLIFLTTCPEDMRVLGAGLHNALAKGAHVMCIVHQAHLWDYKHVSDYTSEISLMRPWIERGQWHFAALSRHVHTYIKSNFPQYLETPDRDYRPFLFHPVFNFTAPENLDFNSNAPFAVIPGKFESERRDYNTIVKNFKKLDCDIGLRLVGSGKIPDVGNLDSKIGFETNLNFFEYFHEMSKGVAIIPTLGNEHYLKSQSSSTVATSIIAGTPLIASQRFQNAHSQIPIDSLWLQGEHESELEVLQRIGHMDSKAWLSKKNKVLELRSSLIAENVARAERMLNAIGKKYSVGGSLPE